MNQIPVFGVEAFLPPVCGGLYLTHTEIFEDPRLGVSVRYQGSGSMRADVYLYNLGLPDIPTDLRSPDVLEWFQGAWQDVLTVAEYKQYLEMGQPTFQYFHIPPDKPEPFCLWASFSYRQAPGPEVLFVGRQISHLTLRTDRGFINKVRYSYPDMEEANEVQFRSFLGFLLEWTAAVQQFSYSTID